MEINNKTNPEMIVSEIVNRIKKYRIDYPMTQKELAEKSGVSLRSIAHFEAGNGIQFANLVKLLAALDLAQNLDFLVPDPTVRPSYFVAEDGRRRAPSEKYRKPSVSEWKWGDEE